MGCSSRTAAVVNLWILLRAEAEAEAEEAVGRERERDNKEDIL